MRTKPKNMNIKINIIPMCCFLHCISQKVVGTSGNMDLDCSSRPNYSAVGRP